MNKVISFRLLTKTVITLNVFLFGILVNEAAHSSDLNNNSRTEIKIVDQKYRTTQMLNELLGQAIEQANESIDVQFDKRRNDQAGLLIHDYQRRLKSSIYIRLENPSN